MTYQDAIKQREQYEENTANRLLGATDERIKNVSKRALQEEHTEYASFLISIRDEVVKKGKAGIRTQLLEIKDKVKNKTLLTQDEVDLLQSYNLTYRKGMNVQGRTFSRLLNCDFTGASIESITVNGGIYNCTLSNLLGVTVNGYVSQNTILGDCLSNNIQGDFSNNRARMSFRKNNVNGYVRKNIILDSFENNITLDSVLENKIGGGIINNQVTGGIYTNINYGNMYTNNVSENIEGNIVYCMIKENKYSSAKNNKYGSSTDLLDSSNQKMTGEEIDKHFPNRGDFSR